MLAFAAVGAALVSCKTLEPVRGGVAEDGVSGQVKRVIDGDTFWPDTSDVSWRVWGLHAPERGTPGGPEATAALAQLIAGQHLTSRERNIDRYGRIAGQCFLLNGRDIAEAMSASAAASELLSVLGRLLRDLHKANSPAHAQGHYRN